MCVSSFRLPLSFSAPVPIIATTAHVRRTSFLADVQLVRKCFSNGTEALPGGRHLRVLSVERSTANATETVVLVRFDVAPTVYIRTGVKVIIRRCYLIAIAARPSLASSAFTGTV